MPYKQTIKHESKGLVSNSDTTLVVNTGGKIHSIIPHFKTAAGVTVTEAQIRAEINRIQLTINGTDVVNASPDVIYDMYELLGANVGDNLGIDGVLELLIAKYLFADPVERDLHGIGTLDVNNIQVRITTGTLVQIASVEVFTQRTSKNELWGRHVRLISYQRNFNSTGDDVFDTLPRDIDSAYVAVAMSAGTAGTITEGELKMNSTTLQDRTPLNVNGLFLSNNGLTQPAGYFVYNAADKTRSGMIPMVGVNDLRFTTKFSVAPGVAGYEANVLTVHGIEVAKK